MIVTAALRSRVAQERQVTALLTSSQNAGRDRLGTMNDRSGICSRHCKAANTDGRDQLYALSGIGGLFRSRLTWRFREVEDSTGVSPARGRSPTYPRQYVGRCLMARRSWLCHSGAPCGDGGSAFGVAPTLTRKSGSRANFHQPGRQNGDARPR